MLIPAVITLYFYIKSHLKIYVAERGIFGTKKILIRYGWKRLKKKPFSNVYRILILVSNIKSNSKKVS